MYFFSLFYQKNMNKEWIPFNLILGGEHYIMQMNGNDWCFLQQLNNIKTDEYTKQS